MKVGERNTDKYVIMSRSTRERIAFLNEDQKFRILKKRIKKAGSAARI